MNVVERSDSHCGNSNRLFVASEQRISRSAAAPVSRHRLRDCGVVTALCDQHDLASDAALSQQLLSISLFFKRESLRNEWLDAPLLQDLEEGKQILSEQCRPDPFADAVRYDSFPKIAIARKWRARQI
jgi:hypothetical protein